MSSNEAVKRLTPTFAEQCYSENSRFNFWSQLSKMLTDFQNSFTIDTREKNAVTLCVTLTLCDSWLSMASSGLRAGRKVGVNEITVLS